MGILVGLISRWEAGLGSAIGIFLITFPWKKTFKKK